MGYISSIALCNKTCITTDGTFGILPVGKIAKKTV